MVNVTALTALPQEQLALAYSHEVDEMKRYRWLALNFLSTESTVSCLMAAIGMECEQRLRELQKVARHMELDACVNELAPGATSVDDPASQHVIELDASVTQQILLQVESSAMETYRFFAWLLETNATPELHRPFLAFVNQKNNEYHVIREYRESCWPARSDHMPYSAIARRRNGIDGYPLQSIIRSR